MTDPNLPPDHKPGPYGLQAGEALRDAARIVWRVVRAVLMTALQLVAALIVLFEEWGWKPLSELLGWLGRFKLIARLERWIGKLPPYGALIVFALPTTFLLPLKFLAMWLLAKGQVAVATGLFIGAKIASTALVARIFMLTKPALMKLQWFARAYAWFVPWKDAIFAQIRGSWVWRYSRMLKTAVKLEIKRAWTRWKPWVAMMSVTWRPWMRERMASVRQTVVNLRMSILGR